MSEENVELARQGLEAFNRGDRDAWFLLYDPEVEFHADPEWPEARSLRGREPVWDFLVSLSDAWEQSDGEIVDVIDPGRDKFAVRVKLPVAGKMSGIADMLDQWCVFTVRRGVVFRQEWFASRTKALEAVGPSE